MNRFEDIKFCEDTDVYFYMPRKYYQDMKEEYMNNSEFIKYPFPVAGLCPDWLHNKDYSYFTLNIFFEEVSSKFLSMCSENPKLQWFNYVFDNLFKTHKNLEN